MTAARAVLAAWNRDVREWAANVFRPYCEPYPESPPSFVHLAARQGWYLASPFATSFHSPAGKSIAFTVPPGLEQELRGRFRL